MPLLYLYLVISMIGFLFLPKIRKLYCNQFEFVNKPSRLVRSWYLSNWIVLKSSCMIATLTAVKLFQGNNGLNWKLTIVKDVHNSWNYLDHLRYWKILQNNTREQKLVIHCIWCILRCKGSLNNNIYLRYDY